MRPLHNAWLLVLALAAPVRADPGDGTEPTGIEHVVAQGETLSHIALHYRVSVADLMRWNPTVEEQRLRVGQTLRIDTGQRRVEHEVQRGESLASIAARWEVRPRELLEWNRGLRPNRLRAGQTVTVFTHVPESRSRSVGRPDAGRLLDARPMPHRHRGFFVRTPSRAFGTDETVRWIVEAFERVLERHPRAPRVEIHDLSFRSGGPIHGHHSHESGRDADIAYYQTRCARDCAFRRIRPTDLDVERQWALFEPWLREGRVEAIFMDHELQAALYEHARRSGVSRADLSRFFQYPREPENRYGIIRHHPRHADHFHVRFVCHESDEDCR
ncbi:MAG: penicillin-insensitive murein endopeptidase [Sandaracinaceae bacterium]|nr:penicillin-insensitive murein endopeptidase [Sandaracinaceae bacterium]